MAGLPLPSADDLIFITTLLADMNIIKVSIADYVSDFVTLVKPVINSILVLYVITWGFAMMRGAIDKPSSDAFWRFIKMVLVVTVALESGFVITDITDFVWQLPNEIIVGLDPTTSWFSAILPSGWFPTGSDVVLTLILGVMSYIADFGNAMATADANFLQDSTAIGLYALGGGLSGLAFAIVMVCKVGLAILLAMMPIFIIFILFEKTKPLFDSWINAIVTFILTLIMTYFTIFLLFPILLKTILVYFILGQAQGGVLETKQGFQLMVLLGIYFAIIRQVPLTAASIARGYAASASGRWDNWDTERSGGSSAQKNAGEVSRQVGH